MIVETRDSVYKITGNKDVRKVEKIGEKNEEYSVINVGYKIFGKVTIRIPGIMEISSKDCCFTYTSEIKNISGRIKGENDENVIVIRNNEIVLHGIKFEVEKIIINSRGSITAESKGKLFDYGNII